MHLNQFREEAKRILRFATYWQAQRLESPGQFPLDLEPGEWDEQYMAWSDLEEALEG